MNDFKELLRNRAAASHAIEQPRRAQLRSHAGSDSRDQQRDADGLGHENAASNAGDMAEHVLVSKFREDPKVSTKMLETEQLRPVDLGGSQISRNDADQHCRQKNVALRILHFFRQRRDAIESDIGEHRHRGSTKDAADSESLWVVEWPQKVHLRKLRQMKNVADGIPEERQN